MQKERKRRCFGNFKNLCEQSRCSKERRQISSSTSYRPRKVDAVKTVEKFKRQAAEPLDVPPAEIPLPRATQPVISIRT